MAAKISPAGPILAAKMVRGDQFFCQNRSGQTYFRGDRFWCDSPSNGPFRHAFHYSLPFDNDTQHAINMRVLNEYLIYNVNIREYFTLRVCTAYCIVGHSPPLSIL